MKISRLPPSVIDRLLALDQHAQAQARQAAVAESEVAGARSLLAGHAKADAAGVLRARAEFPETLKRAQEARQRADNAQRVASSVKAYVDLLPDSAEVAVCEPSQSNGIDLSECRGKAAELRSEITRIKLLPPPADRHLIEQFVDAVRAPDEAALAQLLGRYPHFCAPENLVQGHDHPIIDSLRTLLTPRGAMIDFLVERLDERATAAMPPSERPQKTSGLEAQLAHLAAIEVALVTKRIEAGATDVSFSPEVSPWILLGITVTNTGVQLAS